MESVTHLYSNFLHFIFFLNLDDVILFWPIHYNSIYQCQIKFKIHPPTKFSQPARKLFLIFFQMQRNPTNLKFQDQRLVFTSTTNKSGHIEYVVLQPMNAQCMWLAEFPTPKYLVQFSPNWVSFIFVIYLFFFIQTRKGITMEGFSRSGSQ